MALNNRLPLAPRPSGNGNKPRTGMRILSVVLILVGVACIFLFLAGNAGTTMSQLGMGEGLFLLVLGYVFFVISGTPKTDKTVTVFGRTVKKSAFVLIALALAYFLFYGAVSLFSA